MGHFEWGVAGEGYIWRDAVPAQEEPRFADYPGKPSRFLIAGVTPLWKRYQPLKDRPALFRTFAETAPTEAGILAFAKVYGTLGLGERLLDEPTTSGERLQWWEIHIEAMQHTLLVWDALQKRDAASLQRWFTVVTHETRPTVFVPPPNGVHIRYHHDTPMRHSGIIPQFLLTRDTQDLAWPFLHPGVSMDHYAVEPYRPRDAAGWALLWLSTHINTYLRTYTVPYLGFTEKPAEPIPMALQTMPTNLCGALWLQVALAIRGTERFQHCQECQEWFQVPAKARRANTKYCSTKCRVRAARHQAAQPAPVAGA